jgi:uncharacterized membrane protein
MFLKRAWPWVAVTLFLAVAGHFALVFATPWIVNTIWLNRLTAAGVPYNEISHAKRPKPAGKDVVGYDNPDNLPSFMLYDLSKGPVRIKAKVAREAAYWSVSFIDSDTDVFGLVRDADVKGDDVNVLLEKAGQTSAPEAGERVIRSPTDKGVVLFRLIMPNRYDAKTVARLVQANAQSHAVPADAK